MTCSPPPTTTGRRPSANDRVDVAVVDINLPGGSGVDLLQQFGEP